MFIDKAKVKLKAGDGGNGIVAYRREKYVPLGGPYGGDGGDGGDVVFVADSHKSTLLDLRYNKQLKAENGANGKTKKMHGARGKDMVVKVPLGTTIKDQNTDKVLADLIYPEQQVIIAHGGKGGLGNYHYATPRNPAPNYAENGELGEALEISLELRLLADVGLVGFPSVGKSTFISVVSAARPEIGDYPFTTITPNLGVVNVGDHRSFVLADLPGLIENAHLGKGLGIQFLKHIERCRVLIHIIDMSGSEGRDPIEDYKIINHELVSYKHDLELRPQFVVANKMDLEGAQTQLAKFKQAYPDLPVFPISAIKNEGLQPILYAVMDQLDSMPQDMFVEPEVSEVTFTFEDPSDELKIEQMNETTWRLSGERVERKFRQVNQNSEDAIIRFGHTLRKMGVDEALREAGVKDGDIIILMNIQFVFQEQMSD